jgi:hypothetical protein
MLVVRKGARQIQLKIKNWEYQNKAFKDLGLGDKARTPWVRKKILL